MKTFLLLFVLFIIMAKCLSVLDDQDIADEQRVQNIERQIAGNEAEERYYLAYGQLRIRGTIK